MNKLVEVKNNEVWVDSHIVAKKFEMQHKDFMNTAKKVIDKLDNLTGGTDYDVYIMSREFFSLVSMRLKSKKAFEWQVKFNAA